MGLSDQTFARQVTENGYDAADKPAIAEGEVTLGTATLSALNTGTYTKDVSKSIYGSPQMARAKVINQVIGAHDLLIRATYIDASLNTSETGVIPGTVIEDCEDAWDETNWGAAAGDAGTTNSTEGTNAVHLTIDAASAATDYAFEVITGGAQDLSADGFIGFWLTSTVALSSGDLQIGIDDSATFASPILMDIPALSANETKYFIIAYGAGARTAIQTVGINIAVDPGDGEIYIDGVRSLTTAEKTIIDDSLIVGGAAVASKKDLLLGAGDTRVVNVTALVFHGGGSGDDLDILVD